MQGVFYASEETHDTAGTAFISNAPPAAGSLLRMASDSTRGASCSSAILSAPGCVACRVCFASLVSSVAQAARRPLLRAFHAEALVRPLLRMARYSNSTMQSAAFLGLGNLMSYPAAQQCLCEVIREMRARCHKSLRAFLAWLQVSCKPAGQLAHSSICWSTVDVKRRRMTKERQVLGAFKQGFLSSCLLCRTANT